MTYGLLASRAGVYGWNAANREPAPLLGGISDFNIVAVAFAGGDPAAPESALAATATGRLFRCEYSNERQGYGPWHEITTWAGLGMAVVLAPSPAFAADGTLFVGTPEGIYRTQDDGQSWESCNFGLLDEDVMCMVCAPDFAESEVLWAGTAGGGLYFSRNRARAWRESGIGLPDAAVLSLAVSPNYGEDRTLFAGMEGHGIYLSRDGGENWERLALAELSVNTLACSDPHQLWAGTEDGLWRVTIANGEAERVTAAGETVLSVAANVEGHVAVGLFANGLCVGENGKSEAHDVVWHRPQVALHAPPVITRVGDELYALDSDSLIAHSQEDGVLWVEVERDGIEDITALTGRRVVGEGGTSSDLLFAATTAGLSRRRSDTQGWQEIGADGFQGQGVLSVELSPTFALDQALLAVQPYNTLLLSQDGGESWRVISGPWQGHIMHAHFAPQNARELSVLSASRNESGHYDMIVWHTDDMGQNWQTLAGLSSGVPAVLMAWPQDGAEGALFLATQHRVVKLFQQGDPPTLQVHQHFFDDSLRVTALAAAADYAASSTIWAATSGGLYCSADRGLSWGLKSSLPLDLPIVWLNVTATQIYAITLGGRVWRAAL
jgi:photosystem II stability/assembly factor-like uncharacterized protein